MSSFEDDVLKALTDQLNGDITPEEYVERIKDIYLLTTQAESLIIQRKSMENHQQYLQDHLKIMRKQTKLLGEILKEAVATKDTNQQAGENR